MFFTVAVVFIILKCIGVIAWSWWWVLSPLWIGAIFWAFIFILFPLLFSRDPWNI